jgi:hypothetical protein
MLQKTQASCSKGPRAAGCFIKFDKIWLFFKLQRRRAKWPGWLEKGSLRELVVFRQASKTPLVAAGTRFSASGMTKGLSWSYCGRVGARRARVGWRQQDRPAPRLQQTAPGGATRRCIFAP